MEVLVSRRGGGGGAALGPLGSPRAWRWTEVDPFGRVVRCGAREWAEHVVIRPELVPHEDIIRGTVRDPDRVYFDPSSTATTRLRGDPRAEMVHYIGLGRGQGDQEGNAVCVVVKLLPDEATGGIAGYVASMYLPDVPQARLQLVWQRPSPVRAPPPEAP